MPAAYLMTVFFNADDDASARTAYYNMREEILSNLLGQQAGCSTQDADAALAKLENGVALTQVGE